MIVVRVVVCFAVVFFCRGHERVSGTFPEDCLVDALLGARVCKPFVVGAAVVVVEVEKVATTMAKRPHIHTTTTPMVPGLFFFRQRSFRDASTLRINSWANRTPGCDKIRFTNTRTSQKRTPRRFFSCRVSSEGTMMFV